MIRQIPAFILCAAILLVCISSANCENAASDYRYSLDARQTIYLSNVPHVDVNGRTITKYNPGKSFFPILLYHATDFLDYEETIPTPFEDIRAAGFNGVHTTAFTKSGMTKAYMDRLHKNGLRMVKCVAREDEVKQFAKHPAMLAWDIIDEPDADGEFASYPSRFDAYDQIVKMVRQYDKVHPTFVNNVAWISPPNMVWWAKWQQKSDIACHDNYPRGATAPDSFSSAQGIPESVSLAVSVTQQKKPVWCIVQAFSDDKAARWGFPTALELKCMVYTAIIHGATAIDYFTMDNDMSRQGDCIGISPTPQEKYRLTQGGALADAKRMEDIKHLWDATAKINTELKSLVPWILSPTSAANYKVYLRGESKTTVPVRTLLKKYKGEYILLAVNIDNAPIEARIDFDTSLNIKSALAMFEKRNTLGLTNSSLADKFAPFEVHVYRLRTQSNAKILGQQKPK